MDDWANDKEDRMNTRVNDKKIIEWMIRQEVLAEDEFEDEDGSQAKPEQRNRFRIQLKHKNFFLLQWGPGNSGIVRWQLDSRYDLIKSNEHET